MRLSETELSPSLVVFTLGGDGVETGFGANCAAFAGRDATAVVDPLVAPAHARLVDEALARRSFPPVRWVIATHHHTDHVFGASHFRERGAIFVARRAAATRIAEDHPGLLAARQQVPELRALFEEAAVCAPDVAIDGPRTLDLGGRSLELVPLGHAHSPGDCAVLCEAEGAVCCGDVVHAGYHFNYEDADLPGLLDALRALEALSAGGLSRIIPGHGPVGGRELLDAQADYHRGVEALVARSPSAEAARAAILARWPGWRLEPAIATALQRRWR